MSSSKEDTNKAWYLIQCKSRQDERAEENLIRQDYVCYRPKLKGERLVRGQRSMVEESLFPGYLFIRLGQQDDWGPLRSTRGVLRVVSFGKQPLTVGEELILQLQQHEHAPDTQELFAAGEKVRIDRGPFAELEGIFLAMDGDQRVVLLLNFLRREQKVFMPLTAIKKA